MFICPWLPPFVVILAKTLKAPGLCGHMAFRFDFGVDVGTAVHMSAASQNDEQAISQGVPVTPFEVIAFDLEQLRAKPLACSRMDNGGIPLFRAILDVDAVTGIDRDVVRGAYEGGGKTWECTYDLLAMLQGENDAPLQKKLAGQVIFDLGCGTGLLGCAAMGMGASAAVFQDLNASVLRHITASNVVLNLPALGESSSHPRITFLAGDWKSTLEGVRGGACQQLLSGGVDLLMSSETLYDPRAYGVLLDLVAEVLAKPVRGEADTSPGGLRGSGVSSLIRAAKPATAHVRDSMEGTAASVAPSTCTTTAALAESYPREAALLRGRALFATKRHYFGEGLGGGTTAFIQAAEAHPARFIPTIIHTVEDGRTTIREVIELRFRS